MKKMLWVLVILSAIVVIAIIFLCMWEGTYWLQGVYLWIAELENSARGIDGITEASRVKVMDDAVRHFTILKKVCIAVLCAALFIFCYIGKRELGRKEN